MKRSSNSVGSGPNEVGVLSCCDLKVNIMTRAVVRGPDRPLGDDRPSGVGSPVSHVVRPGDGWWCCSATGFCYWWRSLSLFLIGRCRPRASACLVSSRRWNHGIIVVSQKLWPCCGRQAGSNGCWRVMRAASHSFLRVLILAASLPRVAASETSSWTGRGYICVSWY